jgi:hypothetical protein
VQDVQDHCRRGVRLPSDRLELRRAIRTEPDPEPDAGSFATERAQGIARPVDQEPVAGRDRLLISAAA